MNFLVALDVLLGLSVVYLVFALAVTSINEFIAAVVSSRARWLRRGISNLLTEPSAPGNKQSSADGKAGATDAAKNTGRGTMEDPRATQTAAAGRSGVAPNDAEDGKGMTAEAVLSSPFIAYLGKRGIGNSFDVSYVSSWQLLQGILDGAQRGKGTVFDTVETIRTAVNSLPANMPARKVFEDLCSRAGGDIEKFRTLLDEWFKHFEEQMSAWYRQKTQYMLAGISVVIAFGMNVDTIEIASRLSLDPALRKVVAEQAVGVSKANGAAEFMGSERRDEARKNFDSEREEQLKAEELARKCEKDSMVWPTAAGVAGGDSVEQSPCDKVALRKDAMNAAEKLEAARKALDEEQHKLDQRIKDHIDTIADTGLKFGWSTWPWSTGMGVLDIIKKVVGLFLSAFAISLGAPFWFNALQAIASMRAVGKNLVERKGASA